jgi:hypothetical protein
VVEGAVADLAEVRSVAGTGPTDQGSNHDP